MYNKEVTVPITFRLGIDDSDDKPILCFNEADSIDGDSIIDSIDKEETIAILLKSKPSIKKSYDLLIKAFNEFFDMADELAEKYGKNRECILDAADINFED